MLLKIEITDDNLSVAKSSTLDIGRTLPISYGVTE